MPAVTFSRRAACGVVLLALGSVGTALGAQIAPRVLPPPPSRRPPPPPPPSRAAPPPPAAPAAAPITGYEIVAGVEVSVAPLSVATATAQCPTGKIPVGGGYDFRGPADAAYGYEVRGVSSFRTHQRYMKAEIRNANAFVAGTARAHAVCITPPARSREVELVKEGQIIRLDARCDDAERVIGGGVTTTLLMQLNDNFPEGPTNTVGWRGTGWRVYARQNGIGPTIYVSGTLVCAPAASVDGWEHVRSAPVGLGARGRALLELRCPAGKVMLTAGVNGGSSDVNLVVSSLMIRGDGTATAQVLNRSIINDQISPSLVGVCARRA
jgi:hypothetical protein